MKIKEKILDNGNFVINTDFEKLLWDNGITDARSLWSLSGSSVKNALSSRYTEEAVLKNKENSKEIKVYIKRCVKISLKEKLLAYLWKSDIFDAIHEWHALKLFLDKNIPVPIPIAAAKYGNKTCVLTLGIENYKRAGEVFKELAEKEKNHEKIRKKNLIMKIAYIAAQMHSCGFAHQDFYLVHFFVQENNNDSIFLIDLQRAVLKSRFFRRWMIKDLGELLFSAYPFVNKKDMLLFWKVYSENMEKSIYKNKKLLRDVFRKAAKIKRHHEKHRAK